MLNLISTVYRYPRICRVLGSEVRPVSCKVVKGIGRICGTGSTLVDWENPREIGHVNTIRSDVEIELPLVIIGIKM